MPRLIVRVLRCGGADWCGLVLGRVESLVRALGFPPFLFPRTPPGLIRCERHKKPRFQLNLVSRVTSTVISVINSRVSSYNHKMTLKGLRLGFSQRPYLQRSVKIVTLGELLKLLSFLS